MGAKVDMVVTEFFELLSLNAAPNVTGYLRIDKLASSAVADVDDLGLELLVTHQHI